MDLFVKSELELNSGLSKGRRHIYLNYIIHSVMRALLIYLIHARYVDT